MSDDDSGEEVDERRQRRQRMARAVTAVRREWRKVGLVYAVTDAMLALVAVNFALRVLPVADLLVALSLPPDLLPETVAVPAAVGQALGYPGVRVATAAVVGVAVAVLVFATEFAFHVRHRPIDRFESANPEIREALRTARDAVEDGAETRMSAALYDDVLDRLERTSSAGLLSVGRVAATVLLVVAISVASIQASAIGFQVTLEEPDGPADGGGRSSDYAGLQDPDQILGEPEDVDPGTEDIDTTVPTRGGGEGASAPGAYDTVSSVGGQAPVESQQAGYVESERLEDAELIREYNLRIRESEESEAGK